MKTCKEKRKWTTTIPAGGCFPEHVEISLETMHLVSRFSLGRFSDLGLAGFKQLCEDALLPICPHKRIDELEKFFSQAINAGEVHCIGPGEAYTVTPGKVHSCRSCLAKYQLTITCDGFIELHISRYLGNLKTGLSGRWYVASYIKVNPAFHDHCRALSNWLDRMYKPKTGAMYNGGQFEMFVPVQQKKA